MKKLIVKTRLENREAFDAKIASIGMEMSPVIWQHERIFLPHNYHADQNMPRLVTRTEVRATDRPAVYSLYLKRHIEDSGVDWVNFTDVKEYTEAAGIVQQLGFREAAEISRKRQELWLDSRTVIYLDVVEGLDGTYLKIEAELGEDESVEVLRLDLLKILTMLGQKSYLEETYYRLLKGKDVVERSVEAE